MNMGFTRLRSSPSFAWTVTTITPLKAFRLAMVGDQVELPTLTDQTNWPAERLVCAVNLTHACSSVETSVAVAVNVALPTRLRLHLRTIMVMITITVTITESC